MKVDLVESEGGTDFALLITAAPSFLGTLAVPLLRLGWEVTMARAVRGFRAALEVRGVERGEALEEVCREQHVPPAEAARLTATAAL